MAFLGRNPRYALALVALLFFTSILLFNSNLGGGDTYSDPTVTSGKGRVSTIDFLRHTEAGYQQSVIRGRQELIKKHGTSAAKLNP